MVVKEQKQERKLESNKPVANVVESIGVMPKQPADDPSINGLLKGVSPDKIKLAESMGIPLNGIMAWANGVDQKFKEIEVWTHSVSNTIKGLDPLVDLAKKMGQAQQQTQQTGQTQAQGGLGGLGALLPAVMQAFAGGGGNNDLANKALASQINMANAITNAVISKIAGKATSDVANDVIGGG